MPKQTAHVKALLFVVGAHIRKPKNPESLFYFNQWWRSSISWRKWESWRSVRRTMWRVKPTVSPPPLFCLLRLIPQNNMLWEDLCFVLLGVFFFHYNVVFFKFTPALQNVLQAKEQEYAKALAEINGKFAAFWWTELDDSSRWWFSKSWLSLRQLQSSRGNWDSEF